MPSTSNVLSLIHIHNNYNNALYLFLAKIIKLNFSISSEVWSERVKQIWFALRRGCDGGCCGWWWCCCCWWMCCNLMRIYTLCSLCFGPGRLFNTNLKKKTKKIIINNFVARAMRSPHGQSHSTNNTTKSRKQKILFKCLSCQWMNLMWMNVYEWMMWYFRFVCFDESIKKTHFDF